MPQTISGTVESIELLEKRAFAQETALFTRIPIAAKATVVLPDGKKAYVETSVGYRVISESGLASFEIAPSQRNHPWFVEGQAEPVSTVWAGDVVQIQGVVQDRTSRNGRPYLAVNRATIQGWKRPEWEKPSPRAIVQEVTAPSLPSPQPIVQPSPAVEEDASDLLKWEQIAEEFLARWD